MDAANRSSAVRREKATIGALRRVATDCQFGLQVFNSLSPILY